MVAVACFWTFYSQVNQIAFLFILFPRRAPASVEKYFSQQRARSTFAHGKQKQGTRKNLFRLIEVEWNIW